MIIQPKERSFHCCSIQFSSRCSSNSNILQGKREWRGRNQLPVQVGEAEAQDKRRKGRVNRNVLFFVCVSDEESPLRSPDSGEFLPEAGLLGRGRFAAFGVDNVGLE